MRDDRGQLTRQPRALTALIFCLQVAILAPGCLAAEPGELSLTDEEHAWLQAHPVLRLGVDPGWPPFSFTDEGGAPAGLSADILRLVSERLGVRFAPVKGLTWPEVLDGARTRSLDVISICAPTSDREEYLSFSRPLHSPPWVVVTRKDFRRIAGLKRLQGVPVAMLQGHAIVELVQEELPDLPITLVTSADAGLEAVLTGEVDAYIGNLGVIGHLMAERGFSTLRVACDAGFEAQTLHIAVRSDWPELLAIIDKGLASCTRDEMSALRSRWLPLTLDEAAPASSSFLLTGAGLITAALLLFAALLILMQLLLRGAREQHVAMMFGSRRFRLYTMAGISVVVALVGSLTWLSPGSNRERALLDTGAHLSDVLRTTSDRLDLWVQERQFTLRQLCSGHELIAITERLLEVEPDPGSLRASGAQAEARDHLAASIVVEGGGDYLILTPDGLTLSAGADELIGKPHVLAEERPAALRAVRAGAGVLVPPLRVGPAPLPTVGAGSPQAPPTMFFLCPIRRADDTTIAILVLPTDPGAGFSRVLHMSRVGDTGESYAFDDQGRMLSASRFDGQLRSIGLIGPGQASALNIEVRDPGGDMVAGYRPTTPRTERPLTLMAASAIEGRAPPGASRRRPPGPEVNTELPGYRDYRGVPVFGAWIWKPELGIGLTTEIDVAEAMTMHRTILRTMVGIVAITLLLFVGATLLVLAFGERANRALIRARHELEVRVEQRTSELAAKGQELESKSTVLEAVLGSIEEGLIAYDDQLRLIVCNQPFREIRDVPEEVTQPGSTFEDLIRHDVQRQEFGAVDAEEQVAAQVARARKFEPHHFERTRPDGMVIEIAGGPLPGGGFVSTFRNITERRHAAEEIRRQKELLENTLESLTHPFYVIDARDYSVLLRNSAAGSSVDAGAATCHALTHRRETPCDGEAYPCPLEIVKRTKRPAVVEHVHYDAEGRLFNAEVHGYPIFDSAGEVVQMIEYSLDITARKRTEDRLRLQSAALRAAANAIVITDPEGQIRWVNPAFTRLTGYTEEEAVGDTPRILSSGQHDESFYANMWSTIQTGKVWHGEVINRCKDGSLYTEEMTITPVEDETGAVTHHVGIKQDVTRRKEAEEQLKEANAIIRSQKERMERELTVGHEIQMSMVPLTFPAFPERQEMAIHAALEPAREVGGDFYDFFFLDDDWLLFCIGDVSDKGVPAALFMAMSKTLIRSRAADEFSPASILTQVNEELSRDNPLSMFVTIFAALLNVRTGEMIYSNAGHNPPYVLRREGKLQALDQRHGPVVGALEGMTYKEDRTHLLRGDMVILFTDGVTEAQSPEQELLGEEPLEALLRSQSFASTREAVAATLEMVRQFQGNAEQADDITVLAVEFAGPPGEVRLEHVQLSIRNQLTEIAGVTEGVSAWAEKAGIPAAATAQVCVALDELLSNTISYAYQDDDEHEIFIDLERTGDRLTLTTTDDGRPFNPFAQETPDTTLPIEERETGGLGIHLVKSLMSDVSYTRRAGRNVVRLVRRLG